MKVSLEKLGEEPFASVLCYPKPSKVEVRRRLKELERLGVSVLEFVGEKQAFNVPVLGKGCVGIVVSAYRNGERVALKIRRVDADRASMKGEAKLLAGANSVGVGPKLLDANRDFLLMEFVEGVLLPEWVGKVRGRVRLRRVLRQILEQCWRLDAAGLDHGELSHAPKHVIVSSIDEPFIVDFESASLNRRSANVTSICQFLFLGSETAKAVVGKLDEVDGKVIVEALRNYKNDKTAVSFGRVLAACGLQTM